jgi:BMFP domain-containing protein YqiC
MVNKTKILSDLSKMAVDAMGTFSGIKKEVNTIVRLRIDKTINKMNLVRRDEFEVLKKMVQKLVIEKNKSKKTNKKSAKPTRKKKKNRKKRKIT